MPRWGLNPACLQRPRDPRQRFEVVSRIFRTLVGGLLRLSDHCIALPEQLYVQISFGRPTRAGDVA
jgi:hypothetical protein